MTTNPPLTPTELQEILGFTTTLARKAGALILEGSNAIQRASGPGSVGEKKNAVDLVTEYDVRVEELVRNEIASAYPNFHLYEYSLSASWVLNSCLFFCSLRYCIALAKNRTRPGPAHPSQMRRPFSSIPSVRSSFPLSYSAAGPIQPTTLSHLTPLVSYNNCPLADGTTNFVHGYPYACISIGLVDQRIPVLGVIYNPFLEHLYRGMRGAGSFLHTRTDTNTNTEIGAPQRLPLAPASARPLPSLAGALIAVEWGSDRAQDPIRRKADSFSRLAAAPPHGVMAHSLRSVGSAALNIALVAQGALDMYWCVSSLPSLFLIPLTDFCWWWSRAIVVVGRSDAGVSSFMSSALTKTMTGYNHANHKAVGCLRSSLYFPGVFTRSLLWSFWGGYRQGS
jgi:fructose-1,6-bisphosphatase/inositol monophosphatase family enzyme